MMASSTTSNAVSMKIPRLQGLLVMWPALAESTIRTEPYGMILAQADALNLDAILKVLLKLAEIGGEPLAIVMVVLWWLERQDRLRLQRERDELLKRVLTTLMQGTEAIKDLANIITGHRMVVKK